MSAWDVTDPKAVRAAAAECDRIGRTVFLHKYGYGPAREYVLVMDGREYDSKAVLGVAHGYQFPGRGALIAQGEGFKGGQRMTRLLEGLGFQVFRKLGGPDRTD